MTNRKPRIATTAKLPNIPARPMDIAINATAVSAHLSGIGRYALEISRGLLALDATTTAWVCRGGADQLGEFRDQLRYAPEACAPYRGIQGHLKRLAWTQWQASRSAQVRNQILLTCSPLELALHHPRQILTIHDLTPLLFPREHLVQAPIYRHALPALMRSCRHIIAPSQHTRDHAIATWNIPASRITVIPHGISDLFLKPPSEPIPRPHDRPYVLWVGRAHPTKNLPGVLKIHERLIQQGHDVDLLMTGRCPTWITPPGSTVGRVHFLGAVGDLELRNLYHHAHALLLPSWNEGFGLPAVEALACGCPVVGTNHGALPEMQEPGLYLAEPQDVDHLSHLAGTIIRQGCRARLKLPTSEYQWNSSVVKHLQCLQSISF